MKKFFYPAIFHTAEEGGFWVSFPDIPECFTEGDDMEQVYNMAVDALDLALTSRLEEGETLPVPSEPKVPIENGFLVVIRFDMLAYKKKIYEKSTSRFLSSSLMP